MTSSSAPVPRPRSFEIAFWLLVVAAIGLMTSGMMLAATPAPVPVAFRGMGVLFALAGAGLAFLIGRARRGDARFRSAAAGLSFALSGLLAMFTLLSGGGLWVIILILTAAGAVLLTRASTKEWFEDQAGCSDG